MTTQSEHLSSPPVDTVISAGAREYIRAAIMDNGGGEVFFVGHVDADGVVEAVDQNRASTLWRNDDLQRRRLTAPVTFSSYVAVADFEGYVHLLAQTDGRLVGRIRVDRKGVRVAPIVVGDTLYVFGNSGDLVALKLD